MTDAEARQGRLRLCIRSDCSLTCRWQQRQRQATDRLSCFASHGSHLSPADICGLLSRCHVALFPHQEAIRPQWLPAFSPSLQLFFSKHTHLLLTCSAHAPTANTLTTGGGTKSLSKVLSCCWVRLLKLIALGGRGHSFLQRP